MDHHKLEIKVALKIQKSLHEVFEAIVDPSQMANYFVNNPVDVVKVGQQVKVKVIDIDLERQKVSLSMKDDSAPQSERQEQTRDQVKRIETSKKDEQTSESTMKGNITFS